MGYESAFPMAIGVVREARATGLSKAESMAVAYAALVVNFAGNPSNLDTAKCATIAAFNESLDNPAVLPEHSSLTRERYTSAPAGVTYTALYKGPWQAWFDAQSPKYKLFCLMMFEELGGHTDGQGVAWYAMSWTGRPTHWKFEVNGPEITVSRGRVAA